MNAEVVYDRMDTPVGPLWVAATGKGICMIGLGAAQPEAFLARLARTVSPEPPRRHARPLAVALAQLREYFSRIRCEFDLPLDARGTEFQKAVWAEIARIPYGATTTYGEIARRVGHPRATRAVGGAVGANPLSIVVPCHRVLGAGGTLTGYGGGLEVKAALLRLEGVLLS
jgi:O-6-methylguanine DNA methyltransferase